MAEIHLMDIRSNNFACGGFPPPSDNVTFKVIAVGGRYVGEVTCEKCLEVETARRVAEVK